jgi:hypothetical protein
MKAKRNCFVSEAKANKRNTSNHANATWDERQLCTLASHLGSKAIGTRSTYHYPRNVI